MRRRILGLHEESSGSEVSDGLFLVRVERASYRYHPHKPHFALRSSVLQPQPSIQKTISGRLYCTPKALWKLSWSLRDFGYDQQLLAREEIDEKALVGLKGILKVCRRTVNGRPLLNLDAFAPADEWESFPLAGAANVAGEGVT